MIKPYQIEGHQIVTDISIGISVAPMDAVESAELLRNADMALYDAKADGRGTFRFFEPEMNTRMKVRRELEMDLRKALASEQFELYYQPLVILQTNDVNAFEALLRWNHPTRGLVSPADFIPIAEETGLIIPLGEWVLKAACAEAVDWPDHIKVAVNLSPAQLNNRNLVSMVKAALDESGMSPHKLQLEITESVLLQNTFTTLATLHELRKMGVQIALDDFGTGYSSLSYLRSFPFDKIKIDRSFIQDLSNGAEPLAIVNAVAGLAKCLNMTSTAEGVETQRADGDAAGDRLHRNAGLSLQQGAPGQRDPPVLYPGCLQGWRLQENQRGLRTAGLKIAGRLTGGPFVFGTSTIVRAT